MSELKRALAAESAARLGRVGRSVERAVTRLHGVSEAAREEAEYACASTLDDAVAAFNPTARHSGKTIIAFVRERG